MGFRPNPKHQCLASTLTLMFGLKRAKSLIPWSKTYSLTARIDWFLSKRLWNRDIAILGEIQFKAFDRWNWTLCAGCIRNKIPSIKNAYDNITMLKGSWRLEHFRWCIIEIVSAMHLFYDPVLLLNGLCICLVLDLEWKDVKWLENQLYMYL